MLLVYTILHCANAPPQRLALLYPPACFTRNRLPAGQAPAVAATANQKPAAGCGGLGIMQGGAAAALLRLNCLNTAGVLVRYGVGDIVIN